MDRFQTIGVTDDDVTAIHIHDLNRLINGSENSSPDTAETLHVLNVFGVPRGGDDGDMKFDAAASTVTGLWSDSDASLPGVDAPTATLTSSLPMLIRATWLGDSNLDGEFHSTDLVEVFEAGEYEDNTPGNSGWGTGDWNGDGDFGTGDLVAAFTDGGYDQGVKPAAAVPEPTACLLLVAGLIAIAMQRRRP